MYMVYQTLLMQFCYMYAQQTLRFFFNLVYHLFHHTNSIIDLGLTYLFWSVCYAWATQVFYTVNCQKVNVEYLNL
jgi:hypothetical protein